MIPLISIIVPVYNVQNYIEECVQSILNQTFKNLEIILVDDGSTDNSGFVCDSIKSKDNRISVYHKRNGGLSDARNFGINIAKGMYICFVDSDDIIATDFIQSMYEHIIVNDVKIAACGYCHYYDSGELKPINFENIDQVYSNIEAQKYLNIIGYFNVSACNKLFFKELFNSIQFPINKKSEDWFVMYRLIEKSGGIYYNSNIKYYYRQRTGSITKSININYDCIEAAKEVFDYYKRKNWLSAVPYAVQSLAFAYIGVYNVHLCKTKNKKEMLRLRKEVLKFKKILVYSELSISRKIQLSLFLHFKFIYDILFQLFDLRRGRKTA